MQLQCRRVLTFAALAPLAIPSGAALAIDAIEPMDDAPDAVESPIMITDVQPSQSCGGEWTVTLGPSGENALVALLGTNEDYEISVKPDGLTDSLLSNCTLNIAVDAAKGVQYALTKVSYEGRAVLDDGVKAEQTVSYGFAGGPSSPRVTQDWVGPFEGEAVLDQPFPADRLVWSSCGKPSDLQVRTSLFLRNTDPQQSGLLSMSLSSGILMLVLDIATRPCTVGDGAASGPASSP